MIPSTLTARQATALAHPLNSAADLSAIGQLRSIQHVGRGEMLVVILAVDLLAEVGGDCEWWLWSTARIGHLRVPLTDDEAEQLPAWTGPIDDAGDTGARRPRTRRR